MFNLPRSPKFDGSDATECFSHLADTINQNQREAAQADAMLWQLVFGLIAILLILPFKVIKFMWRMYKASGQDNWRDGYHD